MCLFDREQGAMGRPMGCEKSFYEEGAWGIIRTSYHPMPNYEQGIYDTS